MFRVFANGPETWIQSQVESWSVNRFLSSRIKADQKVIAMKGYYKRKQILEASSIVSWSVKLISPCKRGFENCLYVCSLCQTDTRRSSIFSYKKWYLMPLCLTFTIISYGSRVKWSSPRKGVAPSPTPWCNRYQKERLRVILDYGRQLYLFLFHKSHLFSLSYVVSCNE